MNKIIIPFFFIIPFVGIINAIKIRFAANSVFIYDDMFRVLIDQFNQYSKEYNLDIELDMMLFSVANTTITSTSEYGSTVDTLLSKKSIKYDVYCYDPVYIKKYAPNLEDLKPRLSKEHMELYNVGDAPKVSVYDNKWVGLPLFVKYSILYSNIALLNAYNKKIPETWDELIDTAKYIVEEERKHNNTNIVAYNGLFTELNSFSSYYEFIYSFRKTPESTFPGFESDEAIEALKKLKEIKKEISSDDEFKLNEGIILMDKLFPGKGLFLRYWDIGTLRSLMYHLTPSPGMIKGINTSLLGGLNLGISKYIPEENKKAAIKVIEYLTSELVQKNIIIGKYSLYTGIAKFYDDEKICLKLSCSLVKTSQSILCGKLDNINNYDLYSKKVTTILDQYLFGDRELKDALEEVIDITRINSFSMKKTIGLVILIFMVLSIVILLCSFIYLFNWKYKMENVYRFLDSDLMGMHCVGCFLILCSAFFKYGMFSDFKCQFEISMILFGFSFCFIPMIYRLIVCFPEKNQYSKYLLTHKIQFILFFVVLELIVNLFYVFIPFTRKDINFGENSNRKNYSRCVMTNIFGNVIFLLEIIKKVIAMIAILLLSFIEWNVKEIYEEVRVFVITIYVDILASILFLIDYITINNYEILYAIHCFIIIVISISNFVTVYTIKILTSKNLIIIRKDQTNNDSSTSFNEDDITFSSNSNTELLSKTFNDTTISYKENSTY